ncbi:hypothetical protein TNCV_931 [Trichonephila clavipes]|nr:hypothetical protein TNCV_931 [Trichonephila clavipes]
MDRDILSCILYKTGNFRRHINWLHCDDHRTCTGLGLPPYTIITHVIKRQQSVELVCAIEERNPNYPQRIPTCCGIDGNGQADILAKEGSLILQKIRSERFHFIFNCRTYYIKHVTCSIWTSTRGSGSPVVKVSDHGRHGMSSSSVTLKTRRCRGAMQGKSQTSSRWCGEVVRRGWVPAVMSSSSLNHG